MDVWHHMTVQSQILSFVFISVAILQLAIWQLEHLVSHCLGQSFYDATISPCWIWECHYFAPLEAEIAKKEDRFQWSQCPLQSTNIVCYQCLPLTKHISLFASIAHFGPAWSLWNVRLHGRRNHELQMGHAIKTKQDKQTWNGDFYMMQNQDKLSHEVAYFLSSTDTQTVCVNETYTDPAWSSVSQSETVFQKLRGATGELRDEVEEWCCFSYYSWIIL